MHKTEYNEPMFKVVISSAQDVLTSSWAPELATQDPFQTGMEPIITD